MSVFLLQRLGQALVAIFGVMTLVFFIQRLTGDPTYLLVPETATQEDIEAMRRTLGLDQPLLMQYLDYLGDMLRFDLGRSFVQNVAVTEIIASRLPYTLQLAGGALLVALVIGLPVGLALAIWRKHRSTNVLMGFVLGAQSMPTFWSGILMIMVFGVWLGWLPPSGSGSLSHLIMPSIALGLLSMATYARIARSSVLDELSKDYVRSARARGVGTGRLVGKHLLRNSLIPVISISALEISQLLAGAVIVETVFAWPGLGQLTVQSVQSRDFVVVQGIVLLGALVTIGVNLIADILYSVVDPRIRKGDGA
ncbi:ABC transporter permease [Allosediminivita pacifica]|uniref:Peptide/nickel transport system permease protein n=1 Tax=Allosediminivita pacifica TaxID=1267769 RepID=A0A2T6AY84_9RHOB|nr:ABC transporter permease [Allosediminivita pacifica]PTX48762.1 peptide/nickel transport system permease protein [Allosediminivita pacifica]GGB08012.1 peptide ABC transporter permease [Allosediminivita pacifica]